MSTLRALGYSAALRVERDWDKYRELIGDPATGAQVALSGWIPLNPTPADFLAPLSCAAGNSGRRSTKAIVDQAPYAPLVNGTWSELTSERVGNYQFHMLWGTLLEQLWVR